MFNFLELEKDDVKKILKVVGEKDYKKVSPSMAPSRLALNNAFQKAELSRVSISVLRSYVEKNVYNSKDEIVIFYCKMLGKKLTSEYKYTDKIAKVIDDNEYDKLTDEQKEKIEEYREEYNANPVIPVFENYVRFLCVASEESLKKIKDEKTQEIMKEKSELIEKLTNDYNRIVNEYNDLYKKNKQANKELDKANKSIESYKKSVSVDNIKYQLSDILPPDFKATTYREIYNELSRVEENCLEKSDYDLCKRIVAAKYAIVKILKEGSK